MDLRPLHDNLLVELVEEETVVNGIYIPNSVTDKPTKARVIRTGKGRMDKGILCPMDVQEGDLIHFNKGTEVVVDKEKRLALLSEGYILVTEKDGEYHPYWDKVVIEHVAQDKVRESGFVLTSYSEEGFDEGVILKAGPGNIIEGERIPMESLDGEKVIYSRYKGVEMTMPLDDKRSLYILRERDIYFCYND